MQVFYIQQINAAGRDFPVAVAPTHELAWDLADALNAVLGDTSETFIVESVMNELGRLGFSFYRDADKMKWVEQEKQFIDLF